MTVALTGLYACLVLLAGGIYLAMPAERPPAQRVWMAGALVVSGSLVGIGLYLVRWVGAGFEGRVFFVIFSVLAIAAAIRVVTHTRPVYSAVYFVLVMLATTGLCVLAAAEFLAAALVIVYGGAIMVTYVFVIMLAQQAGEAPYDAKATEPLAAVMMGFALLAATTQAMLATDPIALHAAQMRHSVSKAAFVPEVQTPWAGELRSTKLHSGEPARPRAGGRTDALVPGSTDLAAVNGKLGNIRSVGRVLVRDYMIAVQVAGVLMLVAMAGAIAMAHKKIDPSLYTHHEQSQLGQPIATDVGRHVEPFAKVEQHEPR